MLEAVAALIGSAIGAVLAIGGRGLGHPWGLVVGVFGALAAAAGAPDPVASIAAAVAASAAMVDLRWSSMPASAHRLASRWDPVTVRRVVAAETVGKPGWAVPALVLATASGVAAGLFPPATAAVVVLPIVAWHRRRRLGASGSGPVPALDESEAVAVIEDGSPDRSVFEGVVDDISRRGHTAAVAVSPPHLFRGLGGWNLGLGLDAEQAGWAGQLARSLGLEGVLAAPEVAIDTVQAHKLAVCRALASPGEVVVLDEPAAGLEPHDVKALADVVERALAGRRLIVVTADVAGHRTFVSKVRSRT